MKTHKIRLNIEFCDDVMSGKKSFEVRKNDRGYQTGDLIKFIPTDGTCYIDFDGERAEHAKHDIENKTYRITYIINGYGLKNGYVAFGIKEVNSHESIPLLHRRDSIGGLGGIA